jgi:hypothetical protein
LTMVIFMPAAAKDWAMKELSLPEAHPTNRVHPKRPRQP